MKIHFGAADGANQFSSGHRSLRSPYLSFLGSFFRPFGLVSCPRPMACALGCNLSPLRGWRRMMFHDLVFARVGHNLLLVPHASLQLNLFTAVAQGLGHPD